MQGPETRAQSPEDLVLKVDRGAVSSIGVVDARMNKEAVNVRIGDQRYATVFHRALRGLPLL